MDFIEKVKTLQFGKVRHDSRKGKGVFIPPEDGKLGLIIPPGLDVEEETYIAEAEKEKLAKMYFMASRYFHHG